MYVHFINNLNEKFWDRHILFSLFTTSISRTYPHLTVENYISGLWSCKVAWFSKSDYFNAKKNPANLNNHALFFFTFFYCWKGAFPSKVHEKVMPTSEYCTVENAILGGFIHQNWKVLWIHFAEHTKSRLFIYPG